MRRRLALLFVLYLVQGLPFGFQAKALPVYLRAGGHSRTVITLATALALPWFLKALWAPWVDRARGARLGRRRSWILPMQLLLALVCATAAFVHPDDNLAGLLALVLLMNIATATMDIAVDGLAVDSLERGHLGYGNIAQVVGYKAGMIISGGLLLALSDTIGWQGMFALMTALVAAGALATVCFREPASPLTPAGEPAPSSARAVIDVALQVLKTPSARALLLIIVTYKAGESISDALFVPFLYDAGFTKTQIGIWLGTYGMLASIAGSTAGGFLAARTSFLAALAWCAALRVAPIVGQLWLTLLPAPGADAVIAVTAAENFFGGALTTAMFAFMMARVDRRIGAMHYTVLATIEVLGKSISAMAAGPLADATHGYPVPYATACVLSMAFLALLAALAARVGDRHATHA